MADVFENAHNMLKKLQNKTKEENFFKTTLVILVKALKKPLEKCIGMIGTVKEMFGFDEENEYFRF